MADKPKRGTFIHGIAASEHIDSSGERIKIEGVDITSLTKDGTFNYEHDSKSPSSIVGKILEAKKILKRSDCENDHQKYYWDKIKMPYIYVAGELFDSVGHKQAGEVAAMLKYDQMESLNKEAKKLINFSIEGSRVEKSGQIITKCIARKVSVTLTPCNKVCEADELVVDDSKKQSDSGEFSFIQDVMSKADESSCEILKGENPYLYKNENVVIPAKEAVKEHKRLVNVLESPSHKDDKVEAKKQRKELKEYQSKVTKREDKGVLQKPYVSDAQRKWAHTPKGKEALGGAAAVAEWDAASKGKKLPMKKCKLSKYDSNVRKALTASCGMGAPSAKVQDLDKATGNEKGVHHASYEVPETENKTHSGVSVAGAASRWKEKNRAKQIHQKVHNDLKNMPKPNLPKSEMIKSESAMQQNPEQEAIEHAKIAMTHVQHARHHWNRSYNSLNPFNNHEDKAREHDVRAANAWANAYHSLPEESKAEAKKYHQNNKRSMVSQYLFAKYPDLQNFKAVIKKPNLFGKSEMVYKNEQMPAAPKQPSQGNKIGMTQSGKPVFSHAKVADYKDFSPQDHAEAADFHRQMLLKSPSFKDKDRHMQKMRLHNQAFSTGRDRQLKMTAQAPAMPKTATAIPAPAPMQSKPNPATANMQMPPTGTAGYSASASNYGKQPQPQNPVAAAQQMNPNMKMAKSEVFVIRKLDESDINKGSKNVREQRKKVFGTKSQPGAGTAMREKHINHIKNFVDKFLGLDLQPSGGKINDKTGQRRDENAAVGEDKPDWRSGKFEAQWNPEAIVHEIAHLMLMPKGVGLEEGQRLMDKQYSDVQKQYGYMQQKRSQGEVQPMAAEQLIRRALGLPASQVSVPVKSKDDPHRVSVEDGSRIATRVQQGVDKKTGEPKYVDLIRQARNLHPEHKQRLMDIFSGKLKFHPDHGWQPNKTSLDAAITNRQPQAVLARQNKKQMAAGQPSELPPNVVRMKQPAAPAPAAPATPEQAPQQPPLKIAKSEQRKIMKMLGDQAFDKFEKKEELLAFLAEKLPNVSEAERVALAKAVAYTSEKKKELALKALMDEE